MLGKIGCGRVWANHLLVMAVGRAPSTNCQLQNIRRGRVNGLLARVLLWSPTPASPRCAQNGHFSRGPAATIRQQFHERDPAGVTCRGQLSTPALACRPPCRPNERKRVS